MKKHLQFRAHRRRVLIVAVLASTVGCIHKTGGTQATGYEKAVTYSDMLAQTNNSVAKGVIQAQQQGLLTVAQAAAILKVQNQVALDHEALSKMLNQGPTYAGQQGAEIQAILARIKTAIASLDFVSGGLGIKNPQSQQTFSNDANAIASFAQVIVASLTSAGVIK
jgi:hypothetical protein